jgi:hypothetical protein
LQAEAEFYSDPKAVFKGEKLKFSEKAILGAAAPLTTIDVAECRFEPEKGDSGMRAQQSSLPRNSPSTSNC